MKNEMFSKLLNDEVDIHTFEQWLYATPEVKGMFSPDDYLELISTNYQSHLAKHELIKIINQAELETYKLIKLMEAIITKSPSWYDALDQCDTLAHYGYDFLDDLELCSHSLAGQIYLKFGRDKFNELTEEQQNKLSEMCYPYAAECATNVLGWLKEGKIIITEEMEENVLFNTYVYIDYRNEAER